MLALRDLARDEDAEVADVVMQEIDDRLLARDDLAIRGVAVENPVQGLLRRRDVIAPRGEHDDRRLDVAQVDALARGRHDPSARQLVADEEVVHDESHLLFVHEEESAPPALELEIARTLGVDLRVQVVLLGPQRVGWVQALEVGDDVGAVENSIAEVAGK